MNDSHEKWLDGLKGATGVGSSSLEVFSTESAISVNEVAEVL